MAILNFELSWRKHILLLLLVFKPSCHEERSNSDALALLLGSFPVVSLCVNEPLRFSYLNGIFLNKILYLNISVSV